MREITQDWLPRHPEPSAEVTADFFIGRRQELAALIKLLDGGDAKRAAVIQGGVGIGKTSLANELLGHAQKKGFRVLQGSCYPVQATGPYFPFVQIFSQFRVAAPPDKHLPTWFTAELSPRVDWRVLSEDVRSRRARFVRELSEAILQEAASAKTVLCIEDIQWADLGSLLVLNNLLDMRVPDLRIVCTLRTDERAEIEVRQLIGRVEQKSRRMLLRGLSESEAWDLVRSVVEPGLISESEMGALWSFTKGNPLFLRELLTHLQDVGLLKSQTVQEAILRSRTPERLTHVVDLRLRALPETAHEALSAAAVVGDQFSADFVAQVLGKPEEAVQDEFESALGRGILEPVGDPHRSSYRFVHAIFAMRLYDTLPPAGRRDLHRRVARASRYGRIPLSIDELARHYAIGLGSGGNRQAMAHCRAAAERAERLFAYETAARYWELALSCTRTRSRRTRAELYRRLGWASWAASKWDQATGAWEEAVRLFESLRNWRQVAELALALGEVHRWRQDLVKSEVWLERALELLPSHCDEKSRALCLLASIRCLRDEPVAARRLLEGAIQEMGNGTPDPLLIYWLSYGFLTTGDRSTAYHLAEEGLEEAQRKGVPNAICLLAGRLVHRELGQLRLHSARSYARIIERAIETTDTTGLTYLLTSKAVIWAYSGLWKRVLPLCERWMSQIRLAGAYQVANVRVYWAEAKLALGDPAAAKSELLRALPDLEQMRPQASLHLARALLRLGRTEEAASIARRLFPLITEGPRFAAGRVVLGEVLSYLDMPRLQSKSYEMLKGETSPMLVLYSPISVQRVLGRLASRLKLWGPAIDHFDRAVTELSQGKARWELMQSYLDYSEMCRTRRRRGDLRRAAALELEAEAIANELGIKPEALGRASIPSIDGNRFGLTERELEVLRLVAQGSRNSEIAEALTLSHRTVERHLENSFAKMGVSNRAQAVVQAAQEGLVGPLAQSPRNLQRSR